MASNDRKQSGLARLLGSASAGILEIGVFHPVDTISKRLMTNHTRVSTSKELNRVIFREYYQDPAMKRFFSLFPGLGYAACYKVLQRVYKYGGQPFVNEFLNKNYKATFDNTFGEKTGKAMRSATAGSMIGIGEVFLLPLDVLKIKRQTNPEAFKGRGFLKILKDEGLFNLYRGWGWTMARNAPGSFALFGGNAFAKEYILGIKDYSQATFAQNFVSSICGACASLVVSAPLDVIKTRIQNRNFDNPESGVTILRNTLKNEGITAFFKGLTPKLLTTGPKLVFSFALAQSFIPMFDRLLQKN
ncbi:GGC1 (YDL198C) [Zygosaccharomyces parabailii]|uniref:BN860_14510g1_1 n=1 Tax=Zygosaccharomyces bailii (strain CLIB 213 / ATCC 58445 / CBS 680 / BCRC 21525 / NBRC 1098 / NCYC 1416 / NRRL Y-2227) TaxID=1333698 RepID=A0A8J2WVA9_ZYGB2|nr:GGC1 (YDL198C) [Zygosaccharomyces parabailii]CDF87788.1 BN860_14510g1_1 [Zygosaccharomyces bailii CLIB 213]SJM83554.1 Mitochondrial GTP/GDP carrier protein 1 [Zygosaccharomyces bailii]